MSSHVWGCTSTERVLIARVHKPGDLLEEPEPMGQNMTTVKCLIQSKVKSVMIMVIFRDSGWLPGPWRWERGFSSSSYGSTFMWKTQKLGNKQVLYAGFSSSLWVKQWDISPSQRALIGDFDQQKGPRDIMAAVFWRVSHQRRLWGWSWTQLKENQTNYRFGNHLSVMVTSRWR